MYIYYFFACVLFLQSCKESTKTLEEITYSTKLDGKYYLVSIHAHKDVDLNRDAIYSSDLSLEIDALKDTNTYFLELSTTYYNIPYQVIDQWLPFPNVFSDEDGNFLKILYGKKNLASRYNYNEKTNGITIIPVGVIEILSAELLDANKIKINSQMQHYTTNGWEMLQLEAIYQTKN